MSKPTIEEIKAVMSFLGKKGGKANTPAQLAVRLRKDKGGGRPKGSKDGKPRAKKAKRKKDA